MVHPKLVYQLGVYRDMCRQPPAGGLKKYFVENQVFDSIFLQPTSRGCFLWALLPHVGLNV